MSLLGVAQFAFLIVNAILILSELVVIYKVESAISWKKLDQSFHKLEEVKDLEYLDKVVECVRLFFEHKDKNKYIYSFANFINVYSPLSDLNDARSTFKGFFGLRNIEQRTNQLSVVVHKLHFFKQKIYGTTIVFVLVFVLSVGRMILN